MSVLPASTHIQCGMVWVQHLSTLMQQFGSSTCFATLHCHFQPKTNSPLIQLHRALWCLLYWYVCISVVPTVILSWATEFSFATKFPHFAEFRKFIWSGHKPGAARWRRHLLACSEGQAIEIGSAGKGLHCPASSPMWMLCTDFQSMGRSCLRCVRVCQLTVWECSVLCSTFTQPEWFQILQSQIILQTHHYKYRWPKPTPCQLSPGALKSVTVNMRQKSSGKWLTSVSYVIYILQ